MPFWQVAFPDIHICTVICLRNPLDVASSLRRRHGLPKAVALRLWWRYTSDIVRDTDGKPRALVFYEDCLKDLRGVLAGLARTLDVGDCVDSRLVGAAQSLVRPFEGGPSSSLADVLDDPEVPLAVKMLYQGLQGLRATSLGGPARQEVEEALASLLDVIQSEEEALLRLNGQLKTLRLLAAERQSLLISAQARLQTALAAMEEERRLWMTELEELRERWQGVSNSTGYRLWRALEPLVDSLLPPGSRRRRVSAALLRAFLRYHSPALSGDQRMSTREAQAS
jgi:hypothetical protein